MFKYTVIILLFSFLSISSTNAQSGPLEGVLGVLNVSSCVSLLSPILPLIPDTTKELSPEQMTTIQLALEKSMYPANNLIIPIQEIEIPPPHVESLVDVILVEIQLAMVDSDVTAYSICTYAGGMFFSVYVKFC